MFTAAMGSEQEAGEMQSRETVLAKATEEMFEKWGAYIKGEVMASVEDHVLLEKLHSATSDKFKELSTSAGALNSEIATLQAKHKELKPQLEEIDGIEASVDELLGTAQMLDDYAQKIEQKYKAVIVARRS